MPDSIPLIDLLAQIRSCTLCEEHLPLGPRPVVRANKNAQLLIIGQAPGTRVHASGIPWDDPSGDRLRQWLNVDKRTFYDESRIAIMPMGFCYTGKGKSGDLPPRKECATTWHQSLLQQLPNIQLTLLIGQYAQKHYLNDTYKNLTERVKHWQLQQQNNPAFIALPHPSPRNRYWLSQNPWFEQELVPMLRAQVEPLLK